MKSVLVWTFLFFAGWRPTQAQVSPQPTSPASASQAPELARRPAPSSGSPETVDLTVPQGTPLQVALWWEVRVNKAGQAIEGRVVAPVYAFDQVVIPVGTTVAGTISKIEPVSKAQRAKSILNADFSPPHKIVLNFTELTLPGGRHIPIQTQVTPGSGNLINFASSANDNARNDRAAQEVRAAKQQVKQRWDSAIGEIRAPGKFHRLERYGIAQLPVHPQYLDACTVYFAELQAPLDFGSEPLTPQTAAAVAAGPADGSTVEALLDATVTSATARKGDPVAAVITQPLFDQGRMVLPQGSRLEGIVGQAQAARMPGHSGKLLVLFQQVELPSGLQEKIVSTIQGVEADAKSNVKLDSEGGAQANAPKTRYLTTAISLGLAGLSIRGDPDAKTPTPDGTTGNRMAGGAVGFKLVGIVAGALVRSRAFGYSMGAYGGAMSVYSNFIARGRDVVLPKNTAMLVAVSSRQEPTAKP